MNCFQNQNKTMAPSNNPETVDAIKLMVIGSLLCEYGSRLIVDDTKQTLKYRIRCVMNAVKNVEMHFLNHPNTNNYYREHFRKAFNSNETVLLADLILTCWALNEDGLEEIISAIKQVITEPENQ
jgi:hypothetical protein